MTKEPPVKHDAKTRYLSRFRRVLSHIDRHLEEPLELDGLSDIAAFSRFHFHRQFTELFGITVGKYILLSRMKRAAFKLAFREDVPIVEIALESGYGGQDAFSRAFKQLVGQTPADFKRKPQGTVWTDAFAPLGKARNLNREVHMSPRIEIVNFPETHVAVLEHRGDPRLLAEPIRRFIGWRKSVGLVPRVSATFNIFYGDPETTAPEDFRLDLCASIQHEPTANTAGIVAKIIPGGRCAKLRHVGSDDGFGEAFAYLYGIWLPESGEEPRDFPPFCQRVSFFPDVPEHASVTDIFLPLKEATSNTSLQTE